jgi:superfamily I DNA/RNA helicase
LDKGIQFPADDGRRVPAFICTTDEIEVELVVSIIRRQMDKDQLSYKDFMILCPSRVIVNRVSKSLQEKWGIPVRKIAPKSIPEELWRILLVLRLVSGDNNLALRQWLEELDVPREEIIEMRDVALAAGLTLFDVARKSTNTRVQRFFSELEELRATRNDFGELLNKAKFFSGVAELPWKTEAESLSQLITELYEKYGLLDPGEEDEQTDEVLVTTLHSSKGLEAPVVFLVQLSSRYMPNPSRDADEELRLLYVGMTRAKKELYLSSAYIYDPSKKRRVPSISPFLSGIAKHLSMRKIMRAKPKKRKRK